MKEYFINRKVKLTDLTNDPRQIVVRAINCVKNYQKLKDKTVLTWKRSEIKKKIKKNAVNFKKLLKTTNFYWITKSKVAVPENKQTKRTE